MSGEIEWDVSKLRCHERHLCAPGGGQWSSNPGIPIQTPEDVVRTLPVANEPKLTVFGSRAHAEREPILCVWRHESAMPAPRG